VAWILGTWSRERRALTHLAEERAAAAERTLDLEARRAVAEERERIARELHDVVTHHVSVMVIQAEAAGSALPERPGLAAKAVGAIASTGRQALADMRTMLGVLGPPDVDGNDTTTEPIPGLDRIGELIESLRSAGLSVELSVTGERRPLHPGIELSVYRIIQEALTNTLRHARGSRARVALVFGSDDVSVTITDDGGARSIGADDQSGGRGLIGMRERVAMFGGHFEAGPSERGFRVEAQLPLSLGRAT
jgi:signal transduction histidine kinase